MISKSPQLKVEKHMNRFFKKYDDLKIKPTEFLQIKKLISTSYGFV